MSTPPDGFDLPGVSGPLLDLLDRLNPKGAPHSPETAGRGLVRVPLADLEAAAYTEPDKSDLTTQEHRALLIVLALNRHVVQTGGNRADRVNVLCDWATKQIITMLAGRVPVG